MHWKNLLGIQLTGSIEMEALNFCVTVFCLRFSIYGFLFFKGKDYLVYRFLLRFFTPLSVNTV